MNDTIEKPRVKKLPEPARAWRNWYRANGNIRSMCAERDVDAGEVYCGKKIFPSKDVAEQARLDIIEEGRRIYGKLFCESEYLGAFAEGTHP